MAKKNEAPKIGRPRFLEKNKFEVANALKAIEKGEKVTSYYLTRKLVEVGFVEQSNVARETRGRPEVRYDLTSKGRTYVNFSKNWK